MENQTDARTLPMKFQDYIEEPTRFAQLAQALPSHIKPERMARLAMTLFNTDSKLRECRPDNIFASILTAASVGLEIGVNGQAYLVAYKGVCTFVPGWKGIVDIVSRSGRGTVWTGAVYAGDDFDYAYGTSPFIKHRPLDAGTTGRELTHTYAIGSITGSSEKVIEVWHIQKLEEHFAKNNKVGTKHYRFKHPEMYFRKVPLLQVCKYMPSSIELSNVLTAAYAAENMEEVHTESGVVYVQRTEEQEQAQEQVVRQPQRSRKADVSDAQVKQGSSAPAHPTDASISPPATAAARAWVKQKAGAGLEMLLDDAGVSDFDNLTQAELAKCRALLAQAAA